MSVDPSTRRHTVTTNSWNRTALAVVVSLVVVLGVAAPVRAETVYPEWSEVEKARGNEQATQIEITRITNLLTELGTQVQQATELAETRGTEFQVARDKLDAATGKTQNLFDQARQAQDEAAALQLAAGQLAAKQARTTSENTPLEIFFAGSNSTDLLDQLALTSKVAEHNQSLYTRATIAAETAGALASQAELAQNELDRLSEQAQAALDEATAAQYAASTALAAQQVNEAQLTAQLATLRDARISIEQGYAIGEQKRQAAAAAAAAATGGGGPLPGTSGAVSPSGWTNPILAYRGYQGYGMRLHPVYKDWRLHAGDDYGASCGTPIYAAAAGTVTFAGPAGGYGNQVSIDHGGGVTTTYSHMYANGVRVRAGAQVSAGQNIAVVGSAGVSTGCHLHFETRREGIATAPAPLLASKGVG